MGIGCPGRVDTNNLDSRVRGNDEALHARAVAISIDRPALRVSKTKKDKFHDSLSLNDYFASLPFRTSLITLNMGVMSAYFGSVTSK